METLSKKLMTSSSSYTPRIIQFGEGNFMRAFINWQVQQLNNKGIFNGSISIVQPLAQGIGHLFEAQDNLYTVLLEGILNGQEVKSNEIITNIEQLINPYSDHKSFMELAEVDSYELIFSNTTEAGIAFNPEDKLEDQPQSSFPGKLTALLYRRFTLGKKGFTIIPCELIDRNGDKLKDVVLQYCKLWNLGEDFENWLHQENAFCCSLVDRIVPGYPRDKASEYESQLGYKDNLMVVAEPFLLWVIEGPQSLKTTLPLSDIGLQVIVTDDMKPYRERKVHLLNGPHTTMVPLGLLKGLDTVESVMNDDLLYPFIKDVMENEITPTLDLPLDQLQQYSKSIVERFRNPFIAHHLSSIALNSISKYKTRLLPVVLNYKKRQGTWPKKLVLALAAYLVMYNDDSMPVNDDAEIVKTIRQAWQTPETLAKTVLAKDEWWGQDLTQLDGLTELVEHNLEQLTKKDINSVLLETK